MALPLLGAGSGTDGFDPSSVAGLTAWLKADAITGKNDNDPITTWTDSSAAGHSPTQGNAADRPLYKTNIKNGLPVVRFDGSTDSLVVAFTLAQPETIFVVAAYRGARVADDTLFDGTTNTMRAYRSAANTIALYAGGALGDAVISPADVTAFHLYSVVFNGAASSIGVDSGTPDTGSPGTASGDGLALGNVSTGGGAGAVDIGEILVYSGTLSAGNTASVQAYLTSKWGL